MTDVTRWRPPVIPDGCEWWMDTQHNLAARLNRDERRGQVVRVGDRVSLAPGWHGVMVRRLKARPSVRRRAAVTAAVVTPVLAALVYAAYAVAQLVEWLMANAAILVGALLAAAVVLFLFRGRERRRHCPGC